MKKKPAISEYLRSINDKSASLFLMLLFSADLAYIVVHLIHFSSGAILWVAPFLPTNAMHLPIYPEPHVKPRTKENRSPTCYNSELI